MSKPVDLCQLIQALHWLLLRVCVSTCTRIYSLSLQKAKRFETSTLQNLSSLEGGDNSNRSPFGKSGGPPVFHLYIGFIMAPDPLLVCSRSLYVLLRCVDGRNDTAFSLFLPLELSK